MNDSAEWSARLEAWLEDDSPTVALPGSPAVEAVVSWLDKQGLDSLVVDLTSVRDKPSLMQAFQHDLQWPDWFGANWDALADMLMGSEAENARPNVLILVNPADLMACSNDTALTLLSLVEEISANPYSLLLGTILID